MQQYPHTISWENVTQAAPTVDNDGNLIPGTSTKVTVTAPCRMENPSSTPGAGTNTVATQYGTAKEFSMTAFMGRKEPLVTEGVQVQIHNESGALIGKGEVKRVFKGKLNITVWI